MKITMGRLMSKFYSDEYTILNIENCSKVIEKPIPKNVWRTPWEVENGKEWPTYLVGFKKYYTKYEERYSIRYRLNDEYRDERPKYSITVNYELADVKLEKSAIERLQHNANRYQKIADNYKKMLSEI